LNDAPVLLIHAVRSWSVSGGGGCVESRDRYLQSVAERLLCTTFETVGSGYWPGIFGEPGAQVVAILLSPLILRRFGLVWGVVSMELAAGLSLAFLAVGHAPLGALVRLPATPHFNGWTNRQWTVC